MLKSVNPFPLCLDFNHRVGIAQHDRPLGAGPDDITACGLPPALGGEGLARIDHAGEAGLEFFKTRYLPAAEAVEDGPGGVAVGAEAVQDGPVEAAAPGELRVQVQGVQVPAEAVEGGLVFGDGVSDPKIGRDPSGGFKDTALGPGSPPKPPAPT